MNKALKIVIGFFVVVIILLGALYGAYLRVTGNVIVIPEDGNSSILTSGNILFYGDTCPHCKIVEEFIVSNNITEKIAFEQKEVYNNKANSAQMLAIAKSLHITGNQIGVPFLYYKGNYYIGDKDIIDLLKNETGMS